MNRRRTYRPAAGLLAILLGLSAALPARGLSVRTATEAGDQWVTLRRVGSALNLRYSIPAAQEMRLQGSRRLSFEPGSRKLRVGGCLVWLNAATRKIGRHWAVTETDARFVIAPLVRPGDSLRGLRIRTVALDPGHGGRDPGAIGADGLQEKTVTLDLARRVRSRLAHSGLRVVLTRNGDQEMDLASRTQVAQRHNADLFVSIHLNAAASRSAHGVETFVLVSPGYPSTAVPNRAVGRRAATPGHRHSAASVILGYHLQRTMAHRLSATDRGVRRSNFAVLRGASFPAVLVECGFISHAPTERNFRSEAYLNRVASAIAEGILAYARDVNAAQL